MTVPDLQLGALSGEGGHIVLCPLEPGGGGRTKVARCALMIVFAEEFWTPRYTIFILFAKWMIIWVCLDCRFCIANIDGRRIFAQVLLKYENFGPKYVNF